MKLHLTARPPNEGARIVARWVLRSCGGRLDVAAVHLMTTEAMLQRIVAGEMEPGLALGSALATVTLFGLRARDFRREAVCGWFEDEASSAFALSGIAA